MVIDESGGKGVNSIMCCSIKQGLSPKTNLTNVTTIWGMVAIFSASTIVESLNIATMPQIAFTFVKFVLKSALLLKFIRKN